MKLFGGLFFFIVIAIVVFGWLSSGPGSDAAVGEMPHPSLSSELVKPVKRHYEPVSERHFKKPQVEPVMLPGIGRTDVSWGSVGNDPAGNIYVGLVNGGPLFVVVASIFLPFCTLFLRHFSPEFISRV